MDIVERLRDYADGLVGYPADMMVEAADEIERLREAVIEIVYRIGQGDTFGAMDIAAPIANAVLNGTE